MRVNKFKLNIGNLNDSGTTINIPINISFQPIGQDEVIETNFVNKEIEESINPITDYEKVRFIPVDDKDNQIDSITYSINLLNSNNTFPTTTMYSDAGFVYDDVKFNKNSFKRSFLSLNFYDSDIPTNQNLMSFMTLFSRLSINNTLPLTNGGSPVNGGGLPNPIDTIPLRFIVEDPTQFPQGVSEGYNIYHFKDDISVNQPKELYMRATWNNAKTGESIPLITDGSPQMIDNLVSKLHIKYLLKRDNTGYWYEIDTNYSTPNNVNLTTNEVTVQLYQIQAL